MSDKCMVSIIATVANYMSLYDNKSPYNEFYPLLLKWQSQPLNLNYFLLFHCAF